jgi:4-diphosphocytidyl-2-C-methyl-D-erythritol kinase
VTLEVRAHAKINWTLEVLGKRADGYHEVRTVMQTIALADTIRLEPARELTLALSGEAGALPAGGRESNLALRAAELLRERTGAETGARISLAKRIPVAAGLGGGSSDAAAVLRGLCVLWDLAITDDELGSIAAKLGSDAPFFLRGGTALASGRGGVIETLPDVPPQHLALAWPPRTDPRDKTARMYAALRPKHYTDGARTERLAARIRAGDPAADDDIYNVFEAALPAVDSQAAQLMEKAARFGFGQPHLCGSGPAFFLPASDRPDLDKLTEALGALGLAVCVTQTVSAAEAVAVHSL